VNQPRELHLDTTLIGRRLLVYDKLESTNTEALRVAKDRTFDGTVILADEQSAGRGQQSRRWHCPRGSGVLLSAILFPPVPLQRPSLMTALAAVSVCETIREASGLQAKIKWPNDVLICGRKVCGILIERAQGTVIGIGLNVNQTEEHFDSDSLVQATSMAIAAGKTWDVWETTDLLVRHLDREYAHVLAGNFTDLEALWKWRLGLLGKWSVVECLEQNYFGRVRDLTFDAVELEIHVGNTLQIRPETIRHINPV
jgi:BirA family transcriptional regulator, biotin operon repressor / biotin---[acetyl-CoA-carboxylase] ligase